MAGRGATGIADAGAMGKANMDKATVVERSAFMSIRLG